MKSALLLLFCCVSMLCTRAQDNKELKKQLKLVDKYLFFATISTNKFSQSVPFDFGYDAVIMPVMINGKTYHFVFDTGAMTAVSDSLNNTLKLAQSFEGFPVHDAGGNEQKQPIYNIPDLQLGDVHFNNTGCVVINFDALSNMACTQIDGIIGANLMRTCKWMVDFRSKKVSFSNELPQVPENATSLPFHADFSGSPQLKAYYGGFNFDAGWDSGNNGLFCLPDSLFFKSAKSKTTHYAKGSGNAYQSMYKNVTAFKYRTVTDSVVLGDHLFTGELAEVTNLIYPIIGTAFMANHDYFIIDWKSSKIYLSKNGHNGYDEYTRSFGFNMDWDQDVVHVTFVWEGSSAAKAGLKAGDTITSVNGRDVTHISHADWCELREITTKHADIIITAKDAATGQQRSVTVSEAKLLD